MAICTDCEREMTTAASCTVTTLHIGAETYPMSRHRQAARRRCGDCGVEPGGYHHLGCDLARCPRCRQQLISCGCPFDEFGGVGDDDLDADGALAERNACPACGSESVTPILYGLPNPALAALEDRGLLEIGSATGAGRPTSRCRDCDYAWTRGRTSA